MLDRYTISKQISNTGLLAGHPLGCDAVASVWAYHSETQVQNSEDSTLNKQDEDQRKSPVILMK